MEQEPLPPDHGPERSRQDSSSESSSQSESSSGDSSGRSEELGPGSLHGPDLRRDLDQASPPRYDPNDADSHLEEISMWLAAAFRNKDEEMQVTFFNEIAEFFQ